MPFSIEYRAGRYTCGTAYAETEEDIPRALYGSLRGFAEDWEECMANWRWEDFDTTREDGFPWWPNFDSLVIREVPSEVRSLTKAESSALIDLIKAGIDQAEAYRLEQKERAELQQLARLKEKYPDAD